MVMTADDVIDVAADGVADDKPVDWDALASRVSTGDNLARLDCLRIIAAVARIHRSIDDAQPRRVEPAPPRHLPPTLPASDWKGETWGRYQLLEEVGSGSFGRVYRAWDPDLQLEVAIKILHDHQGDSEAKARLLREGRALAKVRDPNVVSVMAVASHGDRVGLCMEFVHGETLEGVLKSRGLLNAREAVLVGQDVCRALMAVHLAGFVHRDVKAHNIMRDRTGRIVLMDFGTGRDVEELERTISDVNVVGTPLYMAPEVLAGQPATFGSDVYGVGVLLYHLVTGKYPVEGRTLKEIRAAHMFATRAAISHRRSDLPAAFIKVIERSLMANPQQRYETAADFLADLAAVNGGFVPGPNIWARAVRFVASGVGVVAVITGFGAVNSYYFNAALGRTEFANEGVPDWFIWGVRSLIAPTIYFGFALIGLVLLLVVRHLWIGASERARDLDQAINARVRRWKLDDLGNLSSCVLLLSVAVLAAASWYFASFLEALFIYPDVSTASTEQLARLSPDFQAEHEAYREVFTFVTIICLMLWYAPLRLAKKRGEPLNRALLSGGAAVVVLAILLLDFPYRMLSQNHFFPVATWKGARCYVLGERADDILLFCPNREPRSGVVSKRSTELEPMGTKESLFVLFSPSKGRK
jgi:hypothetical protein